MNILQDRRDKTKLQTEMTDLRQLLLRQKEQAAAKIEKLASEAETRRSSWIESVRELEAAKDELKKIDLVLKTLDDAAARSAKPTIMQAVLEVLKHKPEGMTALEILDEINSRYFHGTIIRTSLSPQLSRLKDRDHKIKLRGNRWYSIDEEPSLFTPKN